MSRKWFHSNCSADQAEQRLLSEGVDGSFLVRPSSKPGDFTISYKHEDQVSHIKIINDGDSFCLAGSPDPFATLDALVRNYMDERESIKDKSGGLIALLHPMSSSEPTSERWFHGKLGSKETERILLSKGEVGHYLVRESHTQPGQYVLAVKCKNSVHQIIIKQENGIFEILGAPSLKTNSLSDLIDHLVKNPSLRDIKDQSRIVLKEPYHSTSFVASTIKQRVEALKKVSANGMTGFQEEFQELTRNDGVYSMKVGSLANNRRKNRYKNILPYDHSRVHLCVNAKDTSQDEQDDYINANYIEADLDSIKVRYIATQGPTENTISDFWNMIYHENSRVISMLTKEIELGRQKCAKYWPDLGETLKLPNLFVENILETESGHFIRRELKISSIEKELKKEPIIVYQYHYTEWPDHDVPNNFEAILRVRSEMYAKQAMHRSKVSEESNSPIVMHCSAGIGRTGTVIAIDILMHLLDEQGFDCQIDVQKVCQILRTQRSGMVQSEDQYQFIYEFIDSYIGANGDV